MKFRLTYRGELYARKSATVEHIQAIRRDMHKQLKLLWQEKPLSELHSWLQTSEYKNSPERDDFISGDDISIVTEKKGFQFASLVHSNLYAVAELDIIFLRPEPAGRIITRAGDIDNRLKTLFDALQQPELDQIPKNDSPQEGEIPFFCLLEDDLLITACNITSALFV